jgi:ubiquinone/menaquinone biosynthesis C-methylase UbiE
LSSSAEQNRRWWDRTSDEYQERHREFIGNADPRWGMWQLPESELKILGDVSGKDVLELGCGAAQWSILLAKQGARPVGLDNSQRQLDHARRLMAEAGVDFPLVHSSAEDVPLPDGSFDVVFCDHGAFSFADPYRLVPEASRLLRPGGLLAFSMLSAFAAVSENRVTNGSTGGSIATISGSTSSTTVTSSTTSCRTASGFGCFAQTDSSSRT